MASRRSSGIGQLCGLGQAARSLSLSAHLTLGGGWTEDQTWEGLCKMQSSQIKTPIGVMILIYYEVIELISFHTLRATGSRFLKNGLIPHPSHTPGAAAASSLQTSEASAASWTISSPSVASRPSGQGASGRPPWQFTSEAATPTRRPTLPITRMQQESLLMPWGGGHLGHR